MKILFQGDSITDAGRDKEIKEPNFGLKSNLKMMRKSDIRCAYSAHRIRIIYAICL